MTIQVLLAHRISITVFVFVCVCVSVCLNKCDYECCLVSIKVWRTLAFGVTVLWRGKSAYYSLSDNGRDCLFFSCSIKVIR